MPRPRPPHLHREQSRHGRVAWYVRRGGGRRIRLRAEYGAPEFWAEYLSALEGASPAAGTAKPHTLAWALERYRNSSAWAALSNATRRQRENIFRQVVEQKQPSGGLAGDVLLRQITAETIRAARERRAAKPHATNNFIKSMRAFFAWAIENKVVAVDPTRGIKLLHGPNDEIGHHTWTQEELDRFEALWPVGTRERLAYDLLLYTGLRRGDAVRLGRQHVQDGLITIRTEKHRKGKPGELISIPILPPLAASIAATKTGDMTYLVTEAGLPWVKESFGNWFAEVCRNAGCPGSAHGLRKAGATRAAERGATELQLMAIFGWSSPRMAAIYTRAADRKRLATDAAPLLLPAHSENETPAPAESSAGDSANARAKSGA